MSNKPLVSICCITYNQERYIKDALEGFLKQKTNFDYEIIINDDASTDNTTKILREYEEKYKNKIYVVYQKENQYSKGISTLLLVLKRARGKYIAVCEGDDYWICENKLQEQVNYMEEHPKCTFCFHNAVILNMRNNNKNRSVVNILKKDEDYDVGKLEMLGFIPTASFMFKTEDARKIPEWFEKCFVGDWPLKMIMTNFGYAHYMSKKMSVYRKNAQGSVTVQNNEKEEKSIEGKLELLNKKEQVVDFIDNYTNGKYKEVFDYRRKQYQIERMIAENRNKEIITQKCLKGFSFRHKIKYLIKMYCPYLIKLYKELGERKAECQKIQKEK